MNRIYKCFPGGKFKVLTLSYDDGKLEDKRLVDIFNKNGIRATFNVNSGLTDMPIIHKPVRGMALPNGAGNKLITSIAADLGIKYIRPATDQYAVVKSALEYANDCEGPILLGDENGFSMPTDYMNWIPTCHHNHNLVEFGKRFMKLTKKQYLYMMYVWGHSFEFERNNNWEVMEEFCEMIGHRDDIWYATNIEIVDYNEAFDRLQIFADNEYIYNPSACSVWVAVNNVRVIEIPGGETIKL